MKNWTILLIIATIFLTAPITHAEGEEEEIEPTTADVYRAEGVTIILPDQWKTFSFTDESGERTGYLPELWQAWIETTGIPTKIEYLEQAEALERIKNREVDILGGLRYFEEHTEFLDHTDAVHSESSVLAIGKDSDVDCGTVIAKGTIGIVNDAHTLSLAEAKYPYANMVTFPDEKEVINGFIDGKVNGMVVGYPHLDKMDKETPVLGDLNICRTLLYHEVYGGVEKDQTELLELVNDGLGNIPAEKLGEIENRWFLTAEQPKPDWLAASLPAAIVVILILGIGIFWVRKRR